MGGPWSRPVNSDIWERFATWWATENTLTSAEYLAAKRAFLAAIRIRSFANPDTEGRLNAIMRGELRERPDDAGENLSVVRKSALDTTRCFD